MNKQKPNMFRYTNFRKYLSDFYKFKKKTSRTFSHRVFVRSCGFLSPNFLKLVIDGKRKLGKKAQVKLISYIAKNKYEAKYFKALILFQQSASTEEKAEYLSIIISIRHKMNIKELEIDQYQFFSKWYNVALRELVLLDDFKEDVDWINKKLSTNLSESTIKKTIQKLIDVKLLERDSIGKLIQVDSDIICDPLIYSLAVNNYHREMILKGAESIDKVKRKNRDISAITFCVSRESFEQIKEEIKKCRETVHRLSSKTRSKSKKSLYQLNFQLFSLSEVL